MSRAIAYASRGLSCSEARYPAHKLDATSYRWLAALSTFSFDIKYRAGKQNQDADGLSRRPHGS